MTFCQIHEYLTSRVHVRLAKIFNQLLVTKNEVNSGENQSQSLIVFLMAIMIAQFLFIVYHLLQHNKSYKHSLKKPHQKNSLSQVSP